MKKRGFSFLLAGLLALAMALPIFAQTRTPIVGSKYLFGPVTATSTVNLWTTAQPSLNYSNAIVHWITTGTPTCSLVFKVGPTESTATLAVDDPNATINCGASGTKVVSALNNYFNILPTFDSGTLTVYVTLTNFAANALNQTISTAAQGNGAASPGALPWYTQGTDGTNKEPAGDAQARGKHVIPGNGTNADKHILDGVGALGAGVKQVATLGTLSAAVASATDAQVVAAPGSGSIVLLGVFLEKATNTTGTATVEYGTGSNCGTGKTTLLTLGPQTASSLLPIGYYSINALVPAAKALCLVTDGSGTSVRALTQ